MGGTFLGGGQAFPTLAGVLLLGMMYNLLNLGDHYPMVGSCSSGGFLLLVVTAAHRRGRVVNKETWIAVATSFSHMECLRSRQDQHGTTSTRQPTLQHTQVTTRLVVSTLTDLGIAAQSNNQLKMDLA